MARYRLFKKNPITNEWADQGWSDGSGQQDVIRKHREDGTEFFTVPERSFHPVKTGKREVIAWSYTDGEGEVVEGQEPAEEPVDAET